MKITYNLPRNQYGYILPMPYEFWPRCSTWATVNKYNEIEFWEKKPKNRDGQWISSINESPTVYEIRHKWQHAFDSELLIWMRPNTETSWIDNGVTKA
jgi:hypothetical protein